MDTLIHADVFFFITSVAVIILVFLIAVVWFYVVGILKDLRYISRTLKRGIDNTEENMEEIYQNIEDSALFKFVFGKRKKEHKKQK